MSAADAAAALRSSVRGEVTTDAPLAAFTSFRLGGAAAILVEAHDESDLVATASVAATSCLPILSLGRGSNMLVSDRGYPGIVVRLGKGFEWIADSGDGLEAGGATPLPRLANRAAGRGLSGLEFTVAIPASLGGAVRMNAGAHGSSLSEVLDWVRLYRLGDPAPAVLPAAELGMRYRSTNLDDNDVVCAARLALTPAPPGETGEIALRMQRYRDHRAATQPGEARNAGSMFKNPVDTPGVSAGRLIEESGMKGHRAGGAEVSGKHANFFLARPGSTAGDVHRLLVEVQAAVFERTGVLLTPEVRLIGSFEQPDLMRAGGGPPAP
ncbi:MAG TPA: UDP-N-acetylmuramate dehydrogenase [Actinomycetota bacterium]